MEKIGYIMAKNKTPSRTYHDISKRYPEVISALENLGTTVRELVPLMKRPVTLYSLPLLRPQNPKDPFILTPAGR